MVTADRNDRGQIYPHQCNVNVTGTILGDSIVIDNQTIAKVQEIEGHALDVATKRGHCNRIKHIYTAWEKIVPTTTR